MSTTTIRLPEDLKTRVAQVAERAGKTSHALILDAIAQRVSEEERRNDFHETAENRYAKIISSGETIPWSEMRAYLKSRSAGQNPGHPAPKKIAT